MKTDGSSISIGITGHRKLPEERLHIITQAVNEFFAEMKVSHENVNVLSSLAEGADMLCAKIALDLGFRLIVPLPMDVSEYRKDFCGTALAELDRLLTEAYEVFTVNPQEPVPNNPPKGFYYRQAGIYTVEHCDIMLALWDGAKRNTPDGAGTWETIKLARELRKTITTVKW